METRYIFIAAAIFFVIFFICHWLYLRYKYSSVYKPDWEKRKYKALIKRLGKRAKAGKLDYYLMSPTMRGWEIRPDIAIGYKNRLITLQAEDKNITLRRFLNISTCRILLGEYTLDDDDKLLYYQLMELGIDKWRRY